jgi:hypothetical protein
VLPGTRTTRAQRAGARPAGGRARRWERTDSDRCERRARCRAPAGRRPRAADLRTTVPGGVAHRQMAGRPAGHDGRGVQVRFLHQAGGRARWLTYRMCRTQLSRSDRPMFMFTRRPLATLPARCARTMQATYQVQMRLSVQTRANQLTKVAKILKKIMYIFHSLPYYCIKFQVQIHHMLRDTKKRKF